ncbi:HD domain-containing protein [Virgibacillus ainsalahensis]
MKDNQLQAIQDYVYKQFSADATGHDYNHMKRVARLAKHISTKEGADSFICETAAWVHDIGDAKLFPDPEDALENLMTFLASIDLSSQKIKQIKEAINDVSYSKGNTPATLEGKIVQDADRIDAIGAIGIARTFAYGGAKGQLIYHKEMEFTSVQHFYDKLLKLKDRMHTPTAKEIAEERHRFMESFLEQFYKEW